MNQPKVDFQHGHFVYGGDLHRTQRGQDKPHLSLGSSVAPHAWIALYRGYVGIGATPQDALRDVLRIEAAQGRKRETKVWYWWEHQK